VQRILPWKIPILSRFPSSVDFMKTPELRQFVIVLLPRSILSRKYGSIYDLSHGFDCGRSFP
jgi:hypothetical protein